jgi:hypothetical protein
LAPASGEPVSLEVILPLILPTVPENKKVETKRIVEIIKEHFISICLQNVAKFLR